MVRMSPPAVQSLDLAIVGMHCSSCAALIEESLEVDGVTAASVDLAGALARVTFDPAVVSPDALCALVADAGYAAEVVGPASW
jgi:Cu+-exporting ATPase